MHAVRIETTIVNSGEVRLTQLPFKAGDEVEIIVLPRQMRPGTTQPFPLRGVPIHYDHPSAPVAEEDWGGLR